MKLKKIKIFTYLQYDSPLGFETQEAPFLHGFGEHDTRPTEKKKQENIKII